MLGFDFGYWKILDRTFSDTISIMQQEGDKNNRYCEIFYDELISNTFHLKPISI